MEGMAYICSRKDKAMYVEQIKRYEELRERYQQKIVAPMSRQEYFEYAEVLFSAHSCAIEGNSFSVDDTRELKDKGLGMIPHDKSLFEAFEILDHFCAFEFMMEAARKKAPLEEALLKEVNRLCTLHTLTYRVPDAIPGEYTTCDMAAGETLFGDHEQLIARVPSLLRSTEEALSRGVHPMVVAARFHGFYEYLHPFRDGNGRTGRLLSNFILQRMGYPLVIIPIQQREGYLTALRMIRQEGTDEHLIRFFFDVAIASMQSAIKQKENNGLRLQSFLF